MAAEEAEFLSKASDWISLCALLFSGFSVAVTFHQSRQSAKNFRKSDRRTKLIELISVEFAELNKQLDSLDEFLENAFLDQTINSERIAQRVAKTMRRCTRFQQVISALDTVELSQKDLEKIDGLDELFDYANQGYFERNNRSFYLRNSIKVVHRIYAHYAELQAQLIKDHSGEN